MKETEINAEFRLAADLVNQTSRNIFLTGKAGTGKTTFLRHIRATTPKQMAVVAPTGVAAINAGGSTIHSLFQLPFSPYIPETNGSAAGNTINDKHSLVSKLKFNTERIRMLQELELLVIDEISMVRCDVLDSIDAVLKHFRHRHHEPFGGVQLLLIGDLYQLSPVAVNEEWQLLSRFYRSPYFFDSRVMQHSPPVMIEFTRIYRQTDDRFIGMLNEVRNNAVSQRTHEALESLYQPSFSLQRDNGYIILTTHNYKADAINREELDKLPGSTLQYLAKIEGEFGEKAYPAEEKLELKEGAQVMFIRNDREKKYFNGKIGTVTSIERDRICVRCKDETEDIEVNQETWEQLRYTLNESTNQLEEKLAGSFTQYPLRLAWAITIHKSQGLSFDKAVIDAGNSFAPGQVYVALSRCTSLQGVVLLSRITPASLKVDETIVEFSKQCRPPLELSSELGESKKQFQQYLLNQLFDLSVELRALQRLRNHVDKNAAGFNTSTYEWLNSLAVLMGSAADIAARFRKELQQLYGSGLVPEVDTALQQRVKDAAGYFITQFKKLLDQIAGCTAETDSRVVAKQFNETIKTVFQHLALKQRQMEVLREGFSVEDYYRARKGFVMPLLRVNAYAAGSDAVKDTEHPELVSELKALRNAICARTGLPVYMVASGTTLAEMARSLPGNEKQLMLIKGFGRVKVQKYGAEFLEIINRYCEDYGLEAAETQPEPEVLPEPTAVKRLVARGRTMELSYELFQQGKNIEAIAKERGLAVTTIESHLAEYVKKGMIPVEELVAPAQLALIRPLLPDYVAGEPLTPLMEKLGKQVSWGTLKMVIADWERIRANETVTIGDA
ncbi:MAG TPA: helix-turn-helix domain-containing protein [Chitinophagaceae bacterium]